MKLTEDTDQYLIKTVSGAVQASGWFCLATGTKRLFLSQIENPYVTKQHLSKRESFIITLLVHMITVRLFCWSYQSVKICLPMQILLIISHNSLSMNQTNLVLLKASYTITFIAPDNVENVRKAVLTKLRLVKNPMVPIHFLPCRSDYVTAMTSGVRCYGSIACIVTWENTTVGYNPVLLSHLVSTPRRFFSLFTNDNR